MDKTISFKLPRKTELQIEELQRQTGDTRVMLILWAIEELYKNGPHKPNPGLTLRAKLQHALQLQGMAISTWAVNHSYPRSAVENVLYKLGRGQEHFRPGTWLAQIHAKLQEQFPDIFAK